VERDYRILYLEDQEEDLERVTGLLRREYVPAEITWVRGRAALESALEGGWGFDLLLVAEDQAEFLPGVALALAGRRCPDLPAILLCAQRGQTDHLACLAQGAVECVPKAELDRLAAVVRRTLKSSRDQAALRTALAENARLVVLLRTVLESTPEGILVTDLAGRITTYNRKFMTLCGIPEYVMAPMELERVLQFFQDQFQDRDGFLREARLLVDQGERKAGVLARDDRILEARSRAQHLGGEPVGRVFSLTDVTARERAAIPPGMPADLLEAARSGRVVPWYLSDDDLVISEKGLEVLGLAPGGLPRDLPALELLIHPADLDRFHQALERPRSEPVDLTLHRGDGVWIHTRWTLKRSPDGYRGVFMEMPDGSRVFPAASVYAPPLP
jgi:PAS domain-containing protein